MHSQCLGQEVEMANVFKTSLHKYTVQEALNAQFPRIFKMEPTMTADDNADDDVAFEWQEIIGASLTPGRPTTLKTISFLDGDDSGADIEFIFCRGQGDDGDTPTSAQGLIDGSGTGSAAPDITAAEAAAIQVCGNTVVTRNEGDFLTFHITSKTDINLTMAPAKNSRSLFVAGIWRSEPAATGSVGLMDIYFTFEG